MRMGPKGVCVVFALERGPASFCSNNICKVILWGRGTGRTQYYWGTVPVHTATRSEGLGTAFYPR